MPLGLSAGINTNRMDVVSVPQEDGCAREGGDWKSESERV